MASRLYIAGEFPNVPQYMVRWIENPQAMKAHNAMPNLNVSERDARDIAAYLYTLR
jgi:cytochrome c1